jgi:hypothetical protein
MAKFESITSYGINSAAFFVKGYGVITKYLAFLGTWQDEVLQTTTD